jgi:lycopene beta-cyclase
MIDAGLTAGKRILLIDKSSKQTNDRTWCFWEDKPGFFEPVVCKQWDQIWFHANRFSKQFAIAPYQYKMIRGIDFYTHCFNQIHQQPGIEIMNGTVRNQAVTGNRLEIIIDGQLHHFSATHVFNSLWNQEAVKEQKAIHLLQHFKGWMVETPDPFFKPGEATLMDFRVSQANGTTFVYVLPLSATRALVEYTLFSEKLLHHEVYTLGLANYLQDWLQLKDYRVAEEEYGVIPMTNAVFPWYQNGMYHIGTAGGQTKASSGYTFQFIQKQSAAIVQRLLQNTLQPAIQPGQALKKFNFYDSVLLRVLANNYSTGSQVFTSLFKNNRPQDIFAFLDNETSFLQDMRIIGSLPTLPFLKAAIKQII